MNREADNRKEMSDTQNQRIKQEIARVRTLLRSNNDLDLAAVISGKHCTKLTYSSTKTNLTKLDKLVSNGSIARGRLRTSVRAGAE